MQQPQQLIRTPHIPHPRVPRTIFNSVPKASNNENAGQDGEGFWVQGQGDVADDAAEGPEEGDAALAEAVVDVVICDAGEEGAGEEDDEEGGYGGVVDVVVFLDLGC